ncbi:MAG TPA: hypothetical protein VG273_19845 [Bryobacteraceae bacterium]|jgi:hypothetical protein|nr:hypothetical protein [Bryobacteraceae bacterium]
MNITGRFGLSVAVFAVFCVPASRAQSGAGGVTFTKDVAPVLQRACQNCHHPNSIAPMSLMTYDEVRPWARSIKARITIGPHAGVMPPWFVEKDIGIQKIKGDPSLSEQEIATVVKWVNNGAPQGNPADMPKALVFDDSGKWTIGEPDLVVQSKEITVPATGPDQWGDFGQIPTGVTKDRYVQALEIREVNDVPKNVATKTVGGRFVFHHMTYTSTVPGGGGGGTSWPIHEIGRNADLFPPEAGRLLAAGSVLALSAGHVHPNGRVTKSHLEFGFKFFPEGYQPIYKRASLSLGNGIDLDVKPNQANQEIHAYATLQENTKIIAFEPHLHAPGVRMCLESIWGINVQTLSCVGYDHNWVHQYEYDDDAAPLLPKGAIVHLVGFLDTTVANKNPADERNWAGGGRRSIANMFIDLGYSVALTDEQFQAEMAKRRAKMKSRNAFDIGCPLCWAPALTPAPRVSAGGAGGQ